MSIYNETYREVYFQLSTAAYIFIFIILTASARVIIHIIRTIRHTVVRSPVLTCVTDAIHGVAA